MIFDGANRLIILEASDGDSLDVVDIYSGWKDSVVSGDNAAYPAAFSTIGGEPIGGGVFVGAYFFLATTDGWRIRPREASHSLRISGNLYPVSSSDELFTDTLGVYRVRTSVERSSLTQAMSTTGVTSDVIIDALNAQGFTAARAALISQLDPSINGSTANTVLAMQATINVIEAAVTGGGGGGFDAPTLQKIVDIWQLMGLDPDNRLTVSKDSQVAGGVRLSHTEVGNSVTVSRQ